MNREEFKDYFAFSKKEKRGISVLLFFIIITTIMQYSIPFFIPKREVHLITEFSSISPPDSIPSEYQKKIFKKTNDAFFHSENRAQTFTDSSYYFKLKREYPEKPRYQWKKMSIDLNRCDTTEIKRIRGIGSYTARKIIEVREQYGGFHSFDQLVQFKFIKPEVLDSLKVHCFVDTENLRYIFINVIPDTTSRFSNLLTFQECKTVLTYRRNHGAFKSCSDLKKVLVISDEKIEKLCPYLSFDQ